MEMTFSRRSREIDEGIFTILNQKKAELLTQGRKVYNLSIGTPDFKPQPHIMEALVKAAQDPENYKYALTDRPELKEALQAFYLRRFGVKVETDEIMSLYGSQEGMAHIAMALCDPGDVVLAPNPGYPVFSLGPMLCGARIETYPLYAEHNFLPVFEDIPKETARAAKFMVVSYPANPVCTAADDAFYKKLIAFARKYGIVILHDNAYSEIIFDGRVGRSFLSFAGGKEVGVEFNSLSKTYNLTGARVSFMLGNREIVGAFKRLRSQIDYGMFLPIQHAAAAALNGPQDSVIRNRMEYQARRDALCGGLRSIGWEVPDSQGSMFVWAPLPAGYKSSVEFCFELLDRTGLLCTPGSAFGVLGEGYVRFALVRPVPVMKEIVRAVKSSGILEGRS